MNRLGVIELTPAELLRQAGLPGNTTHLEIAARCLELYRAEVNTYGPPCLNPMRSEMFRTELVPWTLHQADRRTPALTQASQRMFEILRDTDLAKHPHQCGVRHHRL